MIEKYPWTSMILGILMFVCAIAIEPEAALIAGIGVVAIMYGGSILVIQGKIDFHKKDKKVKA